MPKASGGSGSEDTAGDVSGDEHIAAAEPHAEPLCTGDVAAPGRHMCLFLLIVSLVAVIALNFTC
jgi:hypothetical protein